MLDKKLLHILDKKFLPEVSDIFGLKLRHAIRGDDDLLVWEIENPNNLPYNVEVIKGYLEKEIMTFEKFAGIKLDRWQRERLSRVRNEDKFYLNQNLKNQIKQELRHLDYMEYDPYTIYGNTKNISFSPGYDYIRLESTFEISLAKKNSVKLTDSEISEMIDKLYDNEEFIMDYTYEFFKPITDILIEYPTLVDLDYIFFEIIITLKN